MLFEIWFKRSKNFIYSQLNCNNRLESIVIEKFGSRELLEINKGYELYAILLRTKKVLFTYTENEMKFYIKIMSK